MENESKTPQTAQVGKKRDNNRKRGHKPKSYFLTPAPASQEAKSEVGETQVSTEKSPAKPNNTNQSNNQNNNQNNSRNKKKHKRNNDKPRDASQNNTQNNSNRDQHAPSPASKSDKLEMMPKKSETVSDKEKYADYDEFSYEEIYGAPAAAEEVTATKIEPQDLVDATSRVDATNLSHNNAPIDDKQVEVVGIKFKESGKTYYFAPAGFNLHVGQHAIVKTSRGLEYGEVAIANTMVKECETVPPLRSVARIATPADIKHHDENKEKENEAFRVCNEKIIAHKLDMKLIDAQYTFDNSKLLFYFTSSGRVDFRELVKDLAAVFRTRIELRQIGIRDEAKMIGGLGMCGRSLCCSMFLTDFGQVSIKMAKEQNLSLNSAKISGNCGRLMCCLRYEQDTYDYEIKHTPPVDTLVRTVDGVGTVCEISPLAGTIKVRLSAQPDVPPKSYKREEVKILKKKQ